MQTPPWSARHRANSSYENSRPITAPTCAISLAGPSRRAAPSAKRANSRAPRAPRTEPRRGLPRLAFALRLDIAFVISSTNRRIPSVRSAISAITSAANCSVPDKVSDDGGHVELPEPIERQARHMRLPDPGRSEFGPEGDDEQHRGCCGCARSSRLSASRLVGSIQCAILEDHGARVAGLPVPQVAMSGRPASSVGAAAASARVLDSGHRWKATAVRQRVRHPYLRPKSARARHRACRALRVPSS